jgi:hypothetical protein
LLNRKADAVLALKLVELDGPGEQKVTRGQRSATTRVGLSPCELVGAEVEWQFAGTSGLLLLLRLGLVEGSTSRASLAESAQAGLLSV